MAAAAAASSTGGGDTPERRRPVQASTLRKWLFICWLFVIIHIWFFSDPDDYPPDLSFGEPARETRQQQMAHVVDQVGYLQEIDVNAVKSGMRRGNNELNAVESEMQGGIKGKGTVSGSDGAINDEYTDAHRYIHNTSVAASISNITNLLGDSRKGGEAKASEVSEEPKTAETAPNKKKLEGDKPVTSISNKTKLEGVDNMAKANNDTNQIKYIPTKHIEVSVKVEADSDNNKGGEYLNNSLAEALQPITYKNCCIPLIFQPTGKGSNDVNCFGTCYNERACTDPNYPFDSAEQKALFPMADSSDPSRMKQVRKACLYPDKLTPRVEWCQKPISLNKSDALLAHLIDEIPPAGCSTRSHAGGSGAFQHVLLFPSHKLAFCGIPKVGITQWEQFLRFYIGAKDYPSLPHYKMDRERLQFDQLDAAAQRRIWEDDEWTWATFIRNPAERLLSGFLDKVAKKAKKEGYKVRLTNATSGGIWSFENFIANLSIPVESLPFSEKDSCKDMSDGRKGLSWCSDPHWRPQVYSCGLSERIDRFHFIGDLENVEIQTKELLSHVGMWDSHGKRFINGGRSLGRSPWCNIGSHPHNHSGHVGFQQKESSDSQADLAYNHVHGSKDKINQFYTPELMKKVEELYADDFKLYNLVSANNGNKLSKGKDLMSQLSSKCAS